MTEALSFGAHFAAMPSGDLKTLARRVESLGYDSIWVPDHLSFHYPIYEALTHLSYIAAVTERVRLGTAVFLLPLRAAGLAAKQVATVDALSGGRVILGVGVGGEWKVEFDLAGVPREKRGARANEAICVMKALWRGESTDFDGAFSHFQGARIDPPPTQPGGPPVLVGGRSEAALRRAGRLGDGYLSYVLSPEGIRKSLETVRREAEGVGRDPSSLQSAHLVFITVRPTYEAALDEAAELLSARYRQDFREPAKKYCVLGPPADCAAQLRRYTDAGVRHLILSPIVPVAEHPEQFEQIAGEVLPALRSG